MSDETPREPNPTATPPAAAPPRQAGAMTRPGAGTSVWPVVIGTLSIVFGAGGIIAYGCLGTGGTLLMSVMAKSFRKMSETNPQLEMQAAQLESMTQYVVPTVISSVVASIIAIVLLVGGIGVVGRRRKGVRTTIVWCILKMLYTVPAVWLSFMMGMAQIDAMQDAAASQASPMPGVFMSLMQTMGPAGAVMQLLWHWAFPVFLLIWFSRRKIKDEVANWLGKEVISDK